MGADDVRAHTDEEKWAIVDRVLGGELSAEQVCQEQGLSSGDLEEWVRGYRRAARRAVDQQLVARLSAHGLDLDSAEATEFQGSVEGLALAELIQTIQFAHRDAEIRIEWDAEYGHIWCVAGEIIDARCAALEGSAAVYRLLSLRHGRVHADFSAVARPRRIEASTQALLLESAKRCDECRQLRERIGDTTAIYVANSRQTRGRLEPVRAEVFAAFDGARSVERVIHDSPVPDLETLDSIAWLLASQRLVPRPIVEPDLSGPVSTARSSAFELSFMPFATSLLSRVAEPQNVRRKLWGGALGGVLAVGGAFAIGFWTARGEAPQPDETDSAAVALRTEAACPTGMSALAGRAGQDPRSALTSLSQAERGRLPHVERFCLGEAEVTVAEYQACVVTGECEVAQQGASSAGARPSSAADSRDGDVTAECNAGQPGRERYPINCVSFQQARQFCEWRGARLPSDAEWTFAARVASDLDLTGGLAEWTSGSGGSRASARDSSDAASNREQYVVLGAGLKPGARGAAPSRLYMSADTRGRSVGFRCARSPELQRTAAVPAH